MYIIYTENENIELVCKEEDNDAIFVRFEYFLNHLDTNNQHVLNHFIFDEESAPKAITEVKETWWSLNGTFNIVSESEINNIRSIFNIIG